MIYLYLSIYILIFSLSICLSYLYHHPFILRDPLHTPATFPYHSGRRACWRANLRSRGGVVFFFWFFFFEGGFFFFGFLVFFSLKSHVLFHLFFSRSNF